MNNYNWLFDLGEIARAPNDSQQDFNYVSNAIVNERDPTRPDIYQNVRTTEEYDYIPENTAANPQGMLSTSTRQPNTTTNEQAFSHELALPRQDGSSSSDVPQTLSMSPDSQRTGSFQASSAGDFESVLTPAETFDHRSQIQFSKVPGQGSSIVSSFDKNMPVAQSQPAYMPKIDEVSRNEILKLLVNARPKTPEGTEISAEHPLLTLSAMQNYLDLFFSRFNVAYPLLHQATFDPSETQPLLLLAVLLLGATYSEKSIHRLAVCIHDALRGQIFQHPSFSAVPELWMLQTILLVECFGKSRAGQKQHDMAHLFHGLLIKLVLSCTYYLHCSHFSSLIRRSDCQTVRPPNFSETSGDLESDWKKAIDFELRKR